LIIGSGLLAASRTFASLEAGYSVLILTSGGVRDACAEIRWRVEKNECRIVDWDSLPPPPTPTNTEDTDKLDEFLSTGSFSLACVTDTVLGPSRRSHTSAETLYRILKSHHIPVNTADVPELCDFTFTSSHRFDDPHTSDRTPLQIGVTSNGQGCRLASRIRRDIVSKLPRQIGVAATKLGRLRQMAKDSAALLESEDADIATDEVNEDNGVLTPNRPVPQRSTSETAVETARRRMKWVAQLSEYWPISKLSDMSEKEMNDVLLTDNLPSVASSEAFSDSRHALDIEKRGRILLVGSGPGHPSLLTIATHTALTRLADLVLSDKLVPDAVLKLIPKNVQIRIARKFPGNADGAQQEMMEAAVEAANQGLTVVRVCDRHTVIMISFYDI
jgi:uroporphyrin-III C-methyltransferase